MKLITSHTPSGTFISRKGLDQAPLRCQCSLIRLMRFNPVAEHIPCKNLTRTDTLPWRPVSHSDTCGLEESVKAYMDGVEGYRPASGRRRYLLQKQLWQICNFKKFSTTLRQDGPSIGRTLAVARDDFAVCGQLSKFNGLMIKGDRIASPSALRGEMVELIHEGHQGLTKCREGAN